MKKLMGVLTLALVFTMGMNAGTGYAWFGKKTSSVRTITKEELSKKMANGEPVQIVNVLNPDYYKLGMIKGSLKIPLSELTKRAVTELDNFHEVVVYCASYQCGASKAAAKKLAKLHFNVYAYEGGIKEWKEAGLPTDTV